MATTATATEVKGGDARVFTVTMDNADTTGSFLHLLPFTPDYATITPFGSATPAQACYAQAVAVSGISATAVNFTKTAGAAVSFQVLVGRSYSPRSGV
jgi:hypothetical protein